ncbi:MAG TPA: FGGY-family carbohydrate kinase [Actinomycetota bacterium]|nr:FGGY-family carbohydrate kinase [Actinomycetota bacterium]
MKVFAGLDIGSSGGRCLLVDERGKRVASGERAWSYRRDTAAIAVLEPEAVIESMRAAVGDALAAAPHATIAAIGVTSQRSGVVLLDGGGAVVHLGLNADGRALLEGLAFERAHGETIYRTAGRLPAMIYLPARLAWFKTHEPAVFERTARALSMADWLVYRLTGAIGTDPTQAAEMLLYDVHARRWSEELAGALEVDLALLPPVGPAGAAVGATSGDALGFAMGIPVVPAGGDTQAAAVAMGVTEPGHAIVVAGTTMICEQVSDEPVIDPGGRLWTSPHAVDLRYVLEAHCGEAGAAIDWLAATMDMVHEELVAVAEVATPGAGGVSFFDSYPSTVADFPLIRTGALQFPVPLMALGRGREDIARAALESIAFGACAGLEWLSDVGGPQRSIAATGGIARAPVFTLALAGACEQPVRVPSERHSSALGAAICAASEHHGSVARAVEAMHDLGHEVAPRAADGYPSIYAAWRERASAMDALSVRVRQFPS